MYRAAEEPASVLVVAFRGQVFGLDRRTGAEVWRFGDKAGTVRIQVTDDRVYVLRYGALACLEYLTGRSLWQVSEDQVGTLLVDHGQVFVAGAGEVRAYSEAGKLLWREPFTGKGAGEVALGVPGTTVQADYSG